MFKRKQGKDLIADDKTDVPTLAVCACGCTLHNPKHYSNTHFYGFFVFFLLLTPILLHSLLGLAFSPVLTGSMRPQINPGDMLITKDTLAKNLHVGDVAVLRKGSENALYSHRIISITPHKDTPSDHLDIRTKGDANPTPEADPVVLNQMTVVQRVVGRVPWVGRIIVNFNSHKGKFLGYLLIFVVFVMTMPKIFRRRPKKAKEGVPNTP